jgi:hypothetical protein
MTTSTKQEALKSLQARGFGSFKNWERENRRGQRVQRHNRNKPLLEALEHEYLYYIRPHLFG